VDTHGVPVNDIHPIFATYCDTILLVDKGHDGGIDADNLRKGAVPLNSSKITSSIFDLAAKEGGVLRRTRFFD
jgi:hypothetical protein